MVRGTDGRLIVKLTGIDLSSIDKAILSLRQKGLTPKDIIIESEAVIDEENSKLTADFKAEDTFKLKAATAEVQAKMLTNDDKSCASRIGEIEIYDLIGGIVEANVSGVIDNG